MFVLFLQEVECTLYDTLGVHSIVVEDFLVVSMYNVLVRDADNAYRYRILGESLCDDTSESTELAVLLHCYYASGLCSSLFYCFCVEWFQ